MFADVVVDDDLMDTELGEDAHVSVHLLDTRRVEVGHNVHTAIAEEHEIVLESLALRLEVFELARYRVEGDYLDRAVEAFFGNGVDDIHIY